MKIKGEKFVFLFFICTILILGNVSAQNDTDTTVADSRDAINKAYECLEDQIESKSALSLQEAVFGVLALGSNNKLIDVIEDEKSSSEECWPKAGCKIKETAQVLLAYNRIGRNTDSIENWLLSEATSVTELDWFLQIDIESRTAGSCTLNYNGQEKTISIDENQVITGNPGTCFSIANSGYWLEIRDNCLDISYEVSCDQDFLTTILYQRGQNTVFVSSEVGSAASLGTTVEQVKAKCFKENAKCNYEGTLWAALALQKRGIETSDYAPYLLALAESNRKYFPSSFLYILFGGDDQYSQIVQEQRQGKYWQATGSPYNRYYDSSLALFSIGASGAAEVDNARNYLTGIQTSEGCWNNNNVRDTGFVLYSGWSRDALQVGGSSSPTACGGAGYWCETNDECVGAGGDLLYGYDCTSGGFGLFCCSVDVEEQSCSSRDGLICASNQECTGSSVPSADGSCCLDSCEEIEEDNICELVGGTCRFSCDVGEEESSESCGEEGDRICCAEAFEDSENEGISFVWIALLAVLIVLLIIAILKRDRVKIWVYKIGGGGSRRRPPGAPPAAAAPTVRITTRAPPPVARPVARSAPVRRALSPREKEMQETLKKLKKLGK